MESNNNRRGVEGGREGERSPELVEYDQDLATEEKMQSNAHHPAANQAANKNLPEWFQRLQQVYPKRASAQLLEEFELAPSTPHVLVDFIPGDYLRETYETGLLSLLCVVPIFCVPCCLYYGQTYADTVEASRLAIITEHEFLLKMPPHPRFHHRPTLTHFFLNDLRNVKIDDGACTYSEMKFKFKSTEDISIVGIDNSSILRIVLEQYLEQRKKASLTLRSVKREKAAVQ